MPKCELPVWLLRNQNNVIDYYNVLDYLAFRCSIDSQRNLTSISNWCSIHKSKLKTILCVLCQNDIIFKKGGPVVYHYKLNDMGYKWLDSLSSLYLRVLNHKKKDIENKIAELRLTCERHNFNCLELPKGIDYYVEYLS